MPGGTFNVVDVNYVLLITDKNLAFVGDPIMCWSEIDVTLRWNEPGSGYFQGPGHNWIREQITPGNRVIVIRDNQILLSGPIEGWLHERSDDGENAGVGKLRVDFADDLALVAAHNVYPDPAAAVNAQTPDTWTYTGNAEVGMRNVVNLNAGPGALAARRVPGLVLGAQANVGSNIQVTAPRMQPIGDVLRAMAETGGNLGFRTRQVGTQILFEVYASDDKSSDVRFGFGLGNMRYVGYEVKAPTATSVAVGGQGTGASSAMIERTNALEMAAWGRFEKFSARNGEDPAQELQDEGDRSLAEGAATIRVATNVSDTPDQRFGEHYGLGDIVSIEIGPGQSWDDVVRTVHLQVQAGSGEYVAATVGSQAATTDPEWSRRMREIDARLGRLERIATPA